MDAIILAAGKGTRMAPLCAKVPKPMLPLAGTPILEHLLFRLAEVGVARVVIVTEYLAETLEATLQVPVGLEAVFVRQGPPRGTGHAVAQAAEHVAGDALLLMGDSLVDQSTLDALVSGEGFVVAAAEVENPAAYGVIEIDGASVLSLQEKASNPPSNLANTGFYRVPKAVLDAAQGLRASPRGELEFTDLVNEAASAGTMFWVQADGWLDIGNPWQYLAAHEIMLALAGKMGTIDGPGSVEDGVQNRGRLWVEKDAIVKSGTYIEGDVRIGKGAIIGPNAYLRGPIDIGEGCKVGAFSEIKNSILLAGAKAPHHNYVGDSVLGHDCNLGSGTKLANIKHSGHTVRVDWNATLLDTGRRKFGGVIGDDAKTGVNATLDPGTIMAAGASIPAGGHGSGWIA